jgi:lipopolysaccharide export system permease protein
LGIIALAFFNPSLISKTSLRVTPFAILLTYRATNDIGIMVNFDWITEPFQKLFSKITQNNTN